MTLNATALVKTMDDLARLTWDHVYDAPQHGIRFNEEAITSQNLYTLQRQFPDLHIRAFSHSEERVNGSDWEWWIGSDRDGWLGMRIQAKKLAGNRYEQISYRSRSATEGQCRSLIRTTEIDADSRALLSFYCFYNGWKRSDGWPTDVPWTIGCSLPAECLSVPDVRVFGCALAPAHQVLGVLESEDRKTNSLRADDYGRFLPLQRPWSWLFADRSDGTVSLTEVLGWLAEWVPISEVGRLQRPYERLPTYAEATRYPEMLIDLRVRDEDVPVSRILVADLGVQ